MNEIARLDAVSVDYPSREGIVHALVDAGLTIHSRETLAIVGRSGSGKTTLVSVMALLRRPTSGTVRINGVETTALPLSTLELVRAKHIGIAFQAHHLEPTLPAIDNVMLPWVFAKDSTPRAHARSRAAELMEALGVGALTKRRPHEMSGGQRQRVALARAMFSRPTLLIADEPTGNLDESSATEVANVLYRLPQHFDTAVVVVTHDNAVAAGAERIVRLSRARIEVPAGHP